MITGKLFLALLSVSLVSASPVKSNQLEESASSVIVSSSSAPAGSVSVASSSSAPAGSVSAAPSSSAPASSVSVGSITSSAAPSASSAPAVGTIDDAALSELLQGNQEFKNSSKLSIAQNLTKNGPEPPFMLIECSDSRVTAGTIFHATLGTIFGQHNLGNLYSQTDANANAALVYGVEELGVKHIIVMGHYGCPTVGEALMSNTTTTKRAETGNSTHNHTSEEVESWIQPIREVYLSSNRSEIVALRNNATPLTMIPNATDPGFRALVEENVKASVARIQKDSILAKAYQSESASGTSGTLTSSVAASSSVVRSSVSATSLPISGSAESTGASSSAASFIPKSSASVSSSQSTSPPPVSTLGNAQSVSAGPSSQSSASAQPSASSGSAGSPAPTGTPAEIDVFVHGFVYDMDTGDVLNLGVTFGPPGKILPKVPFPLVASATSAVQSAHSASNTGSASASAPNKSASSSAAASASASAL
ncbi:carbonic anhydrase [Mycena galericulata]|nr:carbonic anhydrase [Mycena galericulata]